jgi:Mycothiol maleylpyruvate isomerase N-terminal domain
MTESRAAFLSAAASFSDQVAALAGRDLTGPGVGDWDLRALVGHTSRSLVTVETYLARPADEVEVPTAAAYYVAIARAGGANTTAITERGREAGVALGDDPAGHVRALLDRVVGMLPAYADDYALDTIVGGMRLDEYLRTRIFELVVHGLDIGDATGARPGFGDVELTDATRLAAEVAVLSGRGPDVLLALTGRRPFPDGLTVV